MIIKKYDASILSYMSFFKKVTKVDLRDCFLVDDFIFFVTETGKAGMAIGKGGKNIQNLKNSLKKDFKILDYANTPENLVKNFVFPLEPESITNENGKIIIQFKASRERRLLLSDNQRKLKQLKEVLKRYFSDIEDVVIPQ